ncbi:putative integral membrane protein [Metabacillus crassostreae]|uniref:LapA family protein n=1 Tax=Metabacillus crassostreae TaxID=929098 RepID=UPI001959301E|nr:lipopolysaccharide assembly protein LapA domain-containing protein [Metabacillus crassostreae]MBM7605785.1 putative integral membrane protein [Metabacillus crassostreae]
MKRQWSLVVAIIFALIIALFAVINVEPVKVDYLFGTSEWPLILIILGSVLMGGFIIASAGVVRILSVQRKLKLTEKENIKLKEELESLKGEQVHLPNNEFQNEEEKQSENV